LLIALSLLVLLAWAVVAFNRLVRLRNQVRTAWADIDVQLARRHDLVPARVAATKAYAGHERAVLRAVTGRRAPALAQDSRPGRGGGRTRAGAGQAVRAQGGLPRPQGQRELPAPAAGPGGGRGAPAVRAPLLQRRGARVQRRHTARARRAGCAPGRLSARGVLRGRRSAARGGTGGAAMNANRFALLALVLPWLLAWATTTAAAERIEAYDVRIDVAADG